MYNWNDLRFLIAVASEGSTLAASRKLGVDQTTVARRIGALERSLGITLFEKRPEGYALTERGRDALALAGRVERAALAIEDAVGAWRRGASGLLRVTTTEALATGVIAPLVAELRNTWPELTVELLADDRRLDLRAGEADIAIRLGEPDPEPELVGRRVGESHWALFCSRSYAEKRGVPATPADLAGHQIIAGSGGMARMPAHLWLSGLAPEVPVALRCNSVQSLVAAVGSGNGIAPLPIFLAGDDPSLMRCLPELSLSAPIWLMYRSGQRDEPHLRIFVDAVSERFLALRGRLAGPTVKTTSSPSGNRLRSRAESGFLTDPGSVGAQTDPAGQSNADRS
jgi:DNA-binding transcriptional LysR family regulator